MTNEQAATKLLNILNDDIYSWSPAVLEAFRMAVDALKGTGGDYISRKEAIDRIESHLRTGDELYPLTYADKVVNHGVEIAASCVYNMPSAQPEPQWIPCSERLPDNDESVLISHSHGVTKAWWNGRFWTSIEVKKYKTVTAWMPLPEPWKEGAE